VEAKSTWLYRPFEAVVFVCYNNQDTKSQSPNEIWGMKIWERSKNIHIKAL
jgi:hypothetical protein